MFVHGYYLNSNYPMEIKQNSIFEYDGNIISEYNEDEIMVNKQKYPGIPSVISIGPEKCGTTSFAEMLDQFDEFIVPSKSAINIKYEMRMFLDPDCFGYHPTNLTKVYLKISSSFNDNISNKCSYKYYKHF